MERAGLLAFLVLLVGYVMVTRTHNTPRTQGPEKTPAPERRPSVLPEILGDLVRAGHDWRPNMPATLLTSLASFGAAVAAAGGRAYVSPHPEALGRTSGPTDSQHYAGATGAGRLHAADVMVEGISLQAAYSIARGLGRFSGIGVYPEWRPHPGLHLDVRPERDPIAPALWARLGGQYLGIEAAGIRA